MNMVAALFSLAFTVSGTCVPGSDDRTSPTDEARVHPAFVMNQRGMQRARSRGRSFAEKGRTIDDLMKSVRKVPKWFRGKKGLSSDSAVWCTSLEGLPVSVPAFHAASGYSASDVAPETSDTVCVVQSVDFIVSLASMPEVIGGMMPLAPPGIARRGVWGEFWRSYEAVAAARSGPPRVTREADPGDVEVIRFVLSDGRGNHYEASVSVGGQRENGTAIYSGAFALPRVIRGTTNIQADGTARGPMGVSSFSVSGTGHSEATLIEYQPWTVERPYLRKAYLVRFPLFGADGKPRITPEVKELTLHILLPNGEQRVVYKLPSRSP